MSRGTCGRCSRLLFPQYGDGAELCAGCAEARQEGLPPAIEPRPGETWQPVRGRIDGTVYQGERGRAVAAGSGPEPPEVRS